MRRASLTVRGLAGLVTAVCLLMAPNAFAACVYPSFYPGDSAPKEQIAGWMGGSAIAAGLPGELPVMASLTDTGVKNLPYGDSDSVGYFAMRTAVWNTGAYAGFPEHPSIQLQWFIDQALKVRQQRVAQGISSYGQDSTTWGEWDADVQRPAAQYRGRYQLRLDESRTLVANGCAAAPDPDPAPAPEPPPVSGGGGTPASPPDAQLFPDSVLPS